MVSISKPCKAIALEEYNKFVRGCYPIKVAVDISAGFSANSGRKTSGNILKCLGG